jgi:hypothetical protein
MSKKVTKKGRKGLMRKQYTPIKTTCVIHLHFSSTLQYDYDYLSQRIDESTRTAISRVTNIIRVLASHFVPLTDTLLLEAYEWTVDQEGGAKDLLQEDVGDMLVATITAK